MGYHMSDIEPFKDKSILKYYHKKKIFFRGFGMIFALARSVPSLK
tara:strand:- start:708 stop:842 length:135 start_codon:yes stop_codon:yes gene_type:complete